MQSLKFDADFETVFDAAARLAKAARASALLLLLDGPTDWQRLSDHAAGVKVLVASDSAEQLDGASDCGLGCVVLDMSESPVYDKLSQALLEAVADELLAPGARVVAAYSGFEARTIDSISMIDLGDHLGRLTVRDLQQLETRVSLDVLQVVVNLALEIGREGREGKPVGTLFVVGDTQKVRKLSRSASFDPVKGYSRKERNLKSARVREGIKEIAQMDGAIIVASDGTVDRVVDRDGVRRGRAQGKATSARDGHRDGFVNAAVGLVGQRPNGKPAVGLAGCKGDRRGQRLVVVAGRGRSGNAQGHGDRVACRVVELDQEHAGLPPASGEPPENRGDDGRGGRACCATGVPGRAQRGVAGVGVAARRGAAARPAQPAAGVDRVAVVGGQNGPVRSADFGRSAD
ncbi:MAG TPA: hypothetical protein VGX76_15610 [Pirellulales bacterium]|nr:hypothetical protein [Pirellulales bacterium]